jgi:hypothetical protein
MLKANRPAVNALILRAFPAFPPVAQESPHSRGCCSSFVQFDAAPSRKASFIASGNADPTEIILTELQQGAVWETSFCEQLQ